MGGSQREEDYDKLLNRMNELGMEEESMQWYLNLRRFGGCTHAGFGMGFERLLIYLTGVDNIRDVNTVILELQETVIIKIIPKVVSNNYLLKLPKNTNTILLTIVNTNTGKE